MMLAVGSVGADRRVSVQANDRRDEWIARRHAERLCDIAED